MLEYCKTILQKVSFSKTLFEKELRKSLTLISKEERVNFILWCKANFAGKTDAIDKFALIVERTQ